MYYYYGCMYASYVRTLTVKVKLADLQKKSVRPRVREKLAKMQKTARP